MTSFGIALRKMRLDRQELLRDMAAKLEVSSAFLSAIETGKKKVPMSFVDKVSNIYTLDPKEREELQQAADMSVQEVKLSLVDATPAQHQLAVSFAKALNGLTDEEVCKIMRVFNSRKKK